jgi:hypothetical protein
VSREKFRCPNLALIDVEYHVGRVTHIKAEKLPSTSRFCSTFDNHDIPQVAFFSATCSLLVYEKRIWCFSLGTTLPRNNINLARRELRVSPSAATTLGVTRRKFRQRVCCACSGTRVSENKAQNKDAGGGDAVIIMQAIKTPPSFMRRPPEKQGFIHPLYVRRCAL